MQVNATLVQENDLLGNLEKRESYWNKIKRLLAFMKRFISILKLAAKTKKLTKNTRKGRLLSLIVKNIDSEETIIKLHERR